MAFEVAGMSLDVSGFLLGSLQTVFLLVGAGIILFFIFMRRNWSTFNKDVVIERGFNKPPLLWRGKVILRDGKKVLQIADNGMNAITGNCWYYPIQKAGINDGALDVYRFEQNKSEDLVYLKTEEIGADTLSDMANTEFLSKDELKAVKKFKIAPKSFFSTIKFTEVIDKNVENLLMQERLNSANRLKKPEGFMEKYGSYVLIIIGLFAVYLMVDSNNQASVQNSQAQVSTANALSDITTSLSNDRFCTKFCNVNSTESSIYVYNQ